MNDRWKAIKDDLKRTIMKNGHLTREAIDEGRLDDARILSEATFNLAGALTRIYEAINLDESKDESW